MTARKAATNELATRAALAALPVLLNKTQPCKSSEDEHAVRAINLSIAVGRRFADSIAESKKQ